MSKDIIKISDDVSITETDILIIMMAVMMMVVISQMVTPVATYAQSQMFQGKTDAREINVPSDKLTWIDVVHYPPYTPWSWALFENMGPYSVEIAINDPGERLILFPGGNKTVNRLGAMERISIVFFYCNPTETAKVLVTGEY